MASGSALVAHRATQALNSVSRDFRAQLILVSQETDPAFASTVERIGAEFVAAPAGSTRAEMCDLGMSRAVGSIVAVRDDAAVGDARWLETYRAILPARESMPPMPATIESVVMDSMVPVGAVPADRVTSLVTLESTALTASIEMAAAV